MSQLSLGRFGGVESALPTDGYGVGTYVWLSALLTGLLVLVVPIVTVVSGLPTPVVVLAAAICYLVVVVATGRGFEGLTSAVFVLSVFDIGVTLIEGPGIATVDLVAVDIVAVPLALFFGYRTIRDGLSPAFNARSVAVVCFAGFVCWMFAAGLVANGTSRAAGIMLSIEQLRYFVVFVVTAVAVARTNAWCAVVSFVIAVLGNLLVSLAQILNGGMLGFPFLGEPPDRYLRAFVLGPVEIRTGFYAGGFVGHGRELAMVLLLALPLVVAIAARRPWVSVVPTAGVVAASVLSIRVADTDAGWATLILVVVFFGLYLLGMVLVRVKRRYSTAATLPILAIVAASGAYLLGQVWLVVRESQSPILVFGISSLAIRLKEYVAAVQIAFQYPFFGIGGYNFALSSVQYVGQEDLGVHNTYLSHLAASGFVGFALYILAIVAVFVIAVRLAVATTGTERLLWVAMVVAMGAFHSYSSWMWAFNWVVANTAFWLLAGATVGAAASRYRVDESAARLSARFSF